MSIKIGRKIYHLEEMGTGSFVNLYLGKPKAARRAANSEMIVLKHMQEEYLSNPIVRERFELEFSVLKELANKTDRFLPKPNFGEHNGAPYMTYSHVPGVTLLSMLKEHENHDFSLAHCVKLMQSLLESLVVLHDQNPAIVHSDISPENILVSESRLRLIDFGCAQRVSEGQPAKAWMGKPSYLSPEQARGDSWSKPSDIYQAGVIFFEMVCGLKWNLGTSKGERIAFSSNPAELHSRIGVAPVKARPLLRSMLSPNPLRRPATAKLCLQRLGYILAQL